MGLLSEKTHMYNVKFGHRTWHFTQCRNFVRTKSQSIRSYLEAPTIRPLDNHHSGCPLGGGYRTTILFLDHKEYWHFFKMLLVFFFSFVILMNNLSSKSPVTPKGKKHERRNYSWKMVVWIFHIPYPFSPAPSAFLRRMSLDLNSPDILITS